VRILGAAHNVNLSHLLILQPLPLSQSTYSGSSENLTDKTLEADTKQLQELSQSVEASRLEAASTVPQ
jgi:hypothetical protein